MLQVFFKGYKNNLKFIPFENLRLLVQCWTKCFSTRIPHFQQIPFRTSQLLRNPTQRVHISHPTPSSTKVISDVPSLWISSHINLPESNTVHLAAKTPSLFANKTFLLFYPPLHVEEPGPLGFLQPDLTSWRIRDPLAAHSSHPLQTFSIFSRFFYAMFLRSLTTYLRKIILYSLLVKIFASFLFHFSNS